MTMTEKIEERIDRALLRDVADLIEREPSWFNQESFGDNDRDCERFQGHKCETPCCVAGLIGVLRGYRLDPNESVAQFAMKELRLSPDESAPLFMGSWVSLFGQRAIKELLGPELGLRLPRFDNAPMVLRAIADDPRILWRARYH